MRNAICLLVIPMILLGGCATHHSLAPPTGLSEIGLINDPKEASKLEKAMTDGDIARLLDVNVRPKLPSAIAVAKIQSYCSGYQPYLATIDAEELVGWEKGIAEQEHIRGFRPVSPLSYDRETPTLHSLRVAAAKMDCELLFVYLQSDSSVSNFNEAAALYWTVIGLWIVPGHVYEHKTVMQGILIDSRTGMILGTATGDSHKKRACPAALGDIPRDKLAAEAPREALVDLQKGFGEMIGQLVSTTVAAQPTEIGG